MTAQSADAEKHQPLSPCKRAVLLLLLDSPDPGLYGFEIIRVTSFPSGSVYPVLERLTKADLVTRSWERPEAETILPRPKRRYYQLTPQGRVLARSLRPAPVGDDGSARPAYGLPPDGSKH